jgi:O-antigen/teichoic acid export membrane protein
MPTQTKKITIDAAALFFGKVIGLVLGIVRLNYLATFLGLASFGILNFALYFCSLFQVLFDFGISQLLTRNLARDLQRSSEYVGKAMVLKVIIVFIASSVVGLIAMILKFDPISNWAILLTTIAFAINGLSMVLLSAFQAHRKMVIVSISNIFNDLLLSGLIILIITKYPLLMTALILSVIVNFFNLLILYIVYVHKIGIPRFKIDVALWQDFIRESAPIAVSSFGISMYTFIGTTILKYTRGDIEVGIYTAGYKLISVFTLIPITFSQIIFPIFSDFYKNATSKLAKALQDSLRVMAQISMPLAVGIMILAPKIISLLFPAAFGDAKSVLQIIIIGDAFAYFAWILYAFLLAIDRQRICMKLSLFIALISFIVNMIIVPSWGYIGVAISVLISDILLFLSYSYHSIKIGFSFGDIKSFIKIMIASAILGITLSIFREWYLIPTIACAIIVYVISLSLMQAFGDQEKEFFKKYIGWMQYVRY